MKNIFCLFILSTLMFSCGPEFLIDEQRQIDSDVWQYEDIKSFDVTISDVNVNYNLHLIVNHSTEYDYENVYMKIHTHFPTKEKREEQITIQLSDKRGNWQGKCNASSCKVKVYLLENFKFPESGNYKFLFEQFTRDAELRGIENIQLQLFKSEANS